MTTQLRQRQNAQQQQQQQQDEGYDVPWEFVRRRATDARTSPQENGSCRRVIENVDNKRRVFATDKQRISGGDDPVSSSIDGAQTRNKESTTKKTATVAPQIRYSSDGKVYPKHIPASGDGNLNFNSSSNLNLNLNCGTPPCGVRAQQIRSKQNFCSLAQKEDPVDTVVWEYRKPENDARPLCEYDAPWDSSKIGREQTQSAIRASIRGKLRPSRKDEEEDLKVNIEKSRLEKNSSSLPVNGSVRASPSTSTSRSTDSANSEREHIGGKMSMNVRVETAFCGKPETVIHKKNAQDRDRLIQHLCNGGTGTTAVSYDKKPKENERRSRSENSDVHFLRTTLTSVPVKEEKDDNGPAEAKDGMENAAVSPRENDDALPDYDVPWEFSKAAKATKSIRETEGAVQLLRHTDETANTFKKSVDSKPKLNRLNLSLNFGCAALNSSSAKIEVTVPLNEQLWYHGNVTRAEAEQRLSKFAEGSFLVRVCESAVRHVEEYALSLKGAKGYMHMKIQQDASKRWILGFFSQPFDCIPVMIQYYSVNKLPIKGAEHMRLLRPVADQVL